MLVIWVLQGTGPRNGSKEHRVLANVKNKSAAVVFQSSQLEAALSARP
jgi:hypothetical protein